MELLLWVGGILLVSGLVYLLARALFGKKAIETPTNEFSAPSASRWEQDGNRWVKPGVSLLKSTPGVAIPLHVPVPRRPYASAGQSCVPSDDNSILPTIVAAVVVAELLDSQSSQSAPQIDTQSAPSIPDGVGSVYTPDPSPSYSAPDTSSSYSVDTSSSFSDTSSSFSSSDSGNSW